MRLKALLLSVLLGLCLIAPGRVKAEVWWGYLSSGMEAVVIENNSVPLVSGSIIIKVGSQDETWSIWGAAHLLEHLLFNGTATFTQEALYDTLDRLGAYYNAHTGRYFTHFLVLSPKAFFPSAFTILSEMVFASTLPEDKFQKEKGIVIEEISRQKSWGGDDSEAWLEAVFGPSPLSREVLGTPESIARLARDSVLAFYRTWYRPNNAIVVINGDVKADTMAQFLERVIAPYPPQDVPAHITLDLTPLKAGRSVILRERYAGISSPRICLLFPAPSPRDPDFLSFSLGWEILSEKIKSIFTGIVELHSSYYEHPQLGLGVITTSLPEQITPQQWIDTLQQAVNGLIQEGFTPFEVTRQANQFIRERIFNGERIHYFAMLYAYQWAIVGWETFAQWEQEARIISEHPQLVSSTMKRYIHPERGNAYLLKPYPTQVVSGAGKGSGSVGQRDKGEGLTTPDTTLPHLLYEKTPDGLEIAVRSDPSSRLIAIHLLFPHRWWWDREYGEGGVDLLHRVWEESVSSGGPFYSQAQELGIVVKCADDISIPYDDYYSLPDFSFVRIEALPDRWRETIALIRDMLSAPIDSLALGKAYEKSANARSRWERSAIKEGVRRFRSLISGEQAPQAQSIFSGEQCPPLSQIIELRQRLLNPERVIITAIAPLPPDQLFPALKEVLRSGSLPPSRPFRAVREPSWMDFKGSEKDLNADTIHLGSPQAALVMGKRWESIGDQDLPAITLLNRWFSDLIAREIRERAGLAYELGSSAIVYPDDQGGKWGWWEIVVGTRSQNLALVEKELKRLMGTIKSHNFTSSEIVKMSAMVERSVGMREMSHIGQAYQMGTDLFYWGEVRRNEERLKRLREVSPEMLRQVARQYFSPEGLKVVWVD